MILLEIAPDIKCKILKYIRKHDVLYKFKSSVWCERLEGVLLKQISDLYTFAEKNLLNTS